MEENTKAWIASCPTCQRVKPRNCFPAGLMTPAAIEPYPFRKCSIDVAQCSVSILRNRYIVAIICHFTKCLYAEAIKKNDSKTIGKFLFKVNCLFGPIKTLRSDLGTSIGAESIQELIKKMGTNPRHNTAYMPQQSGQIESQFKYIKTILKSYICTDQSDWDLNIDVCTSALNRHYHNSIKMTPFEALFGVSPTFPIDFTLKTQPTGVELDKRLEKMAEIREKALIAILQAQQKQKKYYDTKRRNVTLQEGYEVLIYMPGTRPGLTQKLRILWTGPRKIHRKISDTIYEINFGTKSKSKLKKNSHGTAAEM